MINSTSFTLGRTSTSKLEDVYNYSYGNININIRKDKMNKKSFVMVKFDGKDVGFRETIQSVDSQEIINSVINDLDLNQ